ncbi:MAG: MFS transporter [Chloroflexota bacterium]|nr:MFS transporter [Chloroflexota bacterium]MDH5242785.1 MFS transporter [Chloroflexota bacterium]
MRFVLANLRAAFGALRSTADDPDLRRLTLGWLAVWTGKGALLVAILVIAYQAGGPIAAAIVGLVSYLPHAILAPFAGIPTARWAAERVLLATNVVRVMAATLAVLVLAIDVPIEWLYVAVTLEAAAGAFTWPLHMALLPSLARTPAQLVGANVTSTAAEGVGSTVGPALGGLMLVTVGPLGAVVAVVAIYVVAVIALAGVRAPRVGRGDGSVQAVVGQLSAGVRALWRLRGPRLVTVGLVLQTFVRGLLTVLIVVAAIELLGMGEQGVGTLAAAIGLGSFVGAFLAITLAGRERMAPTFVTALAAWGLPIAVVGLVAAPGAALVAMLAVGLSNAFLDISGFTLLQRTSTNDSRVAVLGIVDSVTNVAVALGGLAAPILITWLGIRGALVVTGAILPVAAVLVWVSFRAVQEGGPELVRRSALIREVPLLAPLSLASVEHIADRLQPLHVPEGEWLMREGGVGDHYVLIERGRIEVSRGGVVIRTEGPGSGVGEIALLRNVPRTASVRALEPIDAFTLDRTSFIEAVTGHGASELLAQALVKERLEGSAA